VEYFTGPPRRALVRAGGLDGRRAQESKTLTVYATCGAPASHTGCLWIVYSGIRQTALSPPAFA